ncbi:MAG: hypothetical protein Q8N63_03940 [Nanoarchaeota archaeon]|nr:hypothetical protein [Nanoarchaeota archaeon]
MAIDKLFQRFDLDQDFKAWTMARSDEETKRKLEDRFGKERFGGELDLPDATNTLKQALLDKGYEFLESNDVYCGLHGSIIIGREVGKKHKDDFYELANKFNLPYHSGNCYFGFKLEQSAMQKEAEEQPATTLGRGRLYVGD